MILPDDKNPSVSRRQFRSIRRVVKFNNVIDCGLDCVGSREKEMDQY